MSTKVFVGNLSFKTRESDLAHAFEDTCGGKVVNANIITRGPRSLGFGFVEFESAEVAATAVQTMHRKELDGRQINVELARPQRARPPMLPQQPQGAVDASAVPASGNPPQQPPMLPQGVPMPRRRSRRPPMYGYPPMQPHGFFRPPPMPMGMPMMMPAQQPMPVPQFFRPPPQVAQAPMAGPPPAQLPPQQQGPPPMMPPPMYGGPRRRGGPFRGGFRGGRQMMGMGMGGGMRMGQGMGMGMPPQRAPQERPLSKATLFVANLPFVVDDQNLKEIFSDLNVKEAHVVRRPNGRSKGYGFVEFESEEARTKALDTLDKIEVENRVLILKPAMVPPIVRMNVTTAAAVPVTSTPPAGITTAPVAPTVTTPPAAVPAAAVTTPPVPVAAAAVPAAAVPAAASTPAKQ